MILSLSCDIPEFLSAIVLFKRILLLIQILAPIVLVVVSGIDIIKAVMAGNSDEIMKHVHKIPRRLLSLSVVYLAPLVINLGVSLAQDVSEYSECYNKATEENVLIAYQNKAEELISIAEKEKTRKAVSDAKGYLYRISDEDLKKALEKRANKVLQDIINEEEEKAKEEAEKRQSEIAITSNSDFLQVAKTIWRKIANGRYTYNMSGIQIPPPGNTVDCSSFVSWVLYEYGYKNEFGGWQHNTVSFYTTNWKEKLGWTEISVAPYENVISKIKPGDILVRDAGGGAYGHIHIIAEITKNGRVLAYDCGDESFWNNVTSRAGMPYDNTSFDTSDYRAGKIIRVTKK